MTIICYIALVYRVQWVPVYFDNLLRGCGFPVRMLPPCIMTQPKEFVTKRAVVKRKVVVFRKYFDECSTRESVILVELRLNWRARSSVPGVWQHPDAAGRPRPACRRSDYTSKPVIMRPSLYHWCFWTKTAADPVKCFRQGRINGNETSATEPCPPFTGTSADGSYPVTPSGFSIIAPD